MNYYLEPDGEEMMDRLHLQTQPLLQAQASDAYQTPTWMPEKHHQLTLVHKRALGQSKFGPAAKIPTQLCNHSPNISS